jgi:hypothetical protein
VLSVLLVAASSDAFIPGEEKYFTFSRPFSETSIKPTTTELDTSDLLKSTLPETHTEQFTLESTKDIFQTALTVTSIKSTRLELTQQESTTNGETELVTYTPESGSKRPRELSQDITTDTSNGLELTQQDSITSEGIGLVTDKPESGPDPTGVLSQDTTTDTSNGLELTQQDSTTSEGIELVTDTPASGSNPTGVLSQDTTTVTSNGLELTQQDSTTSDVTELVTDTPASRSNPTGVLSQDTTTVTSSGLELVQQYSTTSDVTELVTDTPASGSNPTGGLSQDTTTDTSNGLELEQQDSTTSDGTELVTNTSESGLDHKINFSQISTELIQTTNEATVPDFVVNETNSQNNQTIISVSSVTTTEMSASSLPPTTRKHYTPVYQCVRPGRFPASSSCTEYHVCRRIRSRWLHFKARCPFGRKFSFLYGFCVPSRRSDCSPGSILFHASRKNDGKSSSDFHDSDSDGSGENDSRINKNEDKWKINQWRYFLKEKNGKHPGIFKGATSV